MLIGLYGDIICLSSLIPDIMLENFYHISQHLYPFHCLYFLKPCIIIGIMLNLHYDQKYSATRSSMEDTDYDGFNKKAATLSAS